MTQYLMNRLSRTIRNESITH